MKLLKWMIIATVAAAGMMLDASGADKKKTKASSPKPAPMYSATDHLVCTGIPAVAAVAGVAGGPPGALAAGGLAIVAQDTCYKAKAKTKQLNNMVTGSAGTQKTPASKK